MLIMHQLAGILLHMDALNADPLVAGDAGLFIGLNIQMAFPDQRVIKLRNLIALRQIRIEIILAVKSAPAVDLGVYGKAGAHGLTNAFCIGHGQHAGHGGIHE